MDGSGIIPGDAVRFDPGVELEIWEEMPASTLVSGRPVQRGRLFIDDPARGLTAGIWACSAFVSTMAPHDNDEFMLLLEGAVEIAEPSGKVTRIVAGESFILPKGLVRQWRQTGDVKKIFVILETPDDAAARDARGLAVLKPDPAVALSPPVPPRRCCWPARRNSRAGTCSRIAMAGSASGSGPRPPITAGRCPSPATK